jgi:hypothetical protein
MDIPSISIDYAVMERSKKNKSGILTIWLVWFGSFESVYDYLVALAIQLMKTKHGDWNWQLYRFYGLKTRYLFIHLRPI